MAIGNNWWNGGQGLQDSSEYPGNDYPPGDPPPNDGGVGGGGCEGGTVPESIGADGNWRTPAPGECIDPAEFNRRVDLNIQNNPGQSEPNSDVGDPTDFNPNYKVGTAPKFNAPQFSWAEKFQAPSMEEAMNDPGYKFRAAEGERALQQSQAGKGILRTGGSLKDLAKWSQNFASSEYGNVFDRYLQGYNTRYGVGRDIYDRNYIGAKDMYAPTLLQWQLEQEAIKQAKQNELSMWLHNTPSASSLYGG